MSRENVDHPAHYGGADSPFEPIKIIRAYDLNFALGSAIKYILRAGKKEGEPPWQDLRKAAWYCLNEAEVLETAAKSEEWSNIFDAQVMKSVIVVLDSEARLTTFSPEGNHVLGHILFQPDEGKEEVRVEIQYRYADLEDPDDTDSIRWVYYHPNPDAGSILIGGVAHDEYCESLPFVNVEFYVATATPNSPALRALRDGAFKVLTRHGIL